MQAVKANLPGRPKYGISLNYQQAEVHLPGHHKSEPARSQLKSAAVIVLRVTR
jgi:hypothetical protein